MVRLPLLLNIFLGMATIALAILVIWVKSQIAVESREANALARKIDAEYELQDALKAEWARLQRRDSILELAVARFGPDITNIAEEINVRDLPNRLQEGTGHDRALTMFELAVRELALAEAAEDAPEAYNPTNHSFLAPDPLASLISQDLETQ